MGWPTLGVKTLDMTRRREQINSSFAYLVLLAGGLWLSKSSIEYYQEAKTVFEASQRPLTLEDLPAVTVCYEGYSFQCGQELNGTVYYRWTIDGIDKSAEFE